MSESILHQILHEIKDMRVEQQEMKLEQQDFKSQLNEFRVELREMKVEQQQIKSQLNENTLLVRIIHDRQEETDAKLESLAMDVHKLHGDVTSTMEEQDHYKVLLQQLAAGKERQERILERLSIRSIEHETDITELRRIM